jgi:Tfp pilus assembly protein PilF
MDYAIQTAGEDLRTRLEAARWCLQTALEDPEQLNQAKEHAAKAIRLDEKSMDAMILRGVVALFQKEYEPAERYFLSAHVQSPSNFAASNNLALALCEQDEAKRRRALEYALNNARQHQEDAYAAEAASTYGWVLYRNNKLAEADNVLNRLVRSARVSEDTLYYAAKVAGERRRPEEATQLLQRALGTKRPFSMRPEAQLLLEQLRKPSSGS